MFRAEAGSSSPPACFKTSELSFICVDRSIGGLLDVCVCCFWVQPAFRWSWCIWNHTLLLWKTTSAFQPSGRGDIKQAYFFFSCSSRDIGGGAPDASDGAFRPSAGVALHHTHRASSRARHDGAARRRPAHPLRVGIWLLNLSELPGASARPRSHI